MKFSIFHFPSSILERVQLFNGKSMVNGKWQMAGRRGFTLVELVLAMAIGAIILGLGIPSFRDFRARQQVTQAAETLKTNLHFAQNQALAGVKVPGCGESKLDGWYVSMSAASYTIGARCGGILVGETRTVSFPSGMTMSPLGALIFQPVGQDVGTLSGSAITPISGSYVITIQSSAKTSTVTVQKTGNIQ